MEQAPEKKRRKAKWAECLWCRARGIEVPFRSGKMKCLKKHMVNCEAAFLMEKATQTTSKIDVVQAMMHRQQQLISDLTARIAVLEQRSRRPVDPANLWNKMTAKQAWNRRKTNAMRFIRTTLSQYPGPQKYFASIWEYWEYMQPAQTGVANILQTALWPVLEEGKTTRLRGILTDDPYFIFKQIWGKTSPDGSDLQWFIDALREVGVPETHIDERHIRGEAAHLDRAIRKFQDTHKRSAKGAVTQGLLPLHRIWKNVYNVDEEFLTVAMRSPPGVDLTWENVKLLDLPPLESEAVRDGSTSSQGPQSKTETPEDFVSVRLV